MQAAWKHSANPQVLGHVDKLLVCPIYIEANQLSVEFLFDPLAYLKGSTALTDKICIFWLSKTITLCNCHPDLELFRCQGNIAGDNLIAAANCIPSCRVLNLRFQKCLLLAWGISSLKSRGLKNKVIYSPEDVSFRNETIWEVLLFGLKARERQWFSSRGFCCASIISVAAGATTTLYG